MFLGINSNMNEFVLVLFLLARPKVHVYQSDEPSKDVDTTQLRCDVSGEADSVIWLKDGIKISNSTRFSILNQGSSLIIRMAKVIKQNIN